MNKQIIDPEEVWSMPAEKNEKVWCVVTTILLAVLVFGLLFI